MASALRHPHYRNRSHRENELSVVVIRENAPPCQELSAWERRAKLSHLRPPTFRLQIQAGAARAAVPRAGEGRLRDERGGLTRETLFRHRKCYPSKIVLPAAWSFRLRRAS